MLLIIVSALFLGIFINVFMKKINLPTIIGYIFTGTALAYIFNIHDVANNPEITQIAEFGIVFLMFTIGLEFSFSSLKKMKFDIFVLGTVQVIFTSFVAYFLFKLAFNIPPLSAVILGIAASLSSTAIVLKILNENGDIYKKYGQKSLAILIMQDIAVIPILLFIGVMSSTQSVSNALMSTFVDGTILILLMLVLGKALLTPFFQLITKTKSDEIFVGAILFIAIGASYFAHHMGFAYSLGAFIAGMLISETKFRHQTEADLIPFRDLLLGIFFITVGMQVNLLFIKTHISEIVAISGALFLIKFLVTFLAAKINDNNKNAFKTALALTSVGEFSLALLEIAKNKGLVPSEPSQIMVTSIIISMILAPVILRKIGGICPIVFPQQKTPDTHIDDLDSELKDHIIIIGYSSFTQRLIPKLIDSELEYIVIENDIDRFNAGINLHHQLMFGNALKKDVLRTSGISKCKFVVTTITDSHKTQLLFNLFNTFISAKKIIINIDDDSHLDFEGIPSRPHLVVDNKLSTNAVLLILNPEEFFDF